MKKRFFAILSAGLVVTTLSFSVLSVETAKAEGTMCQTYGYYDAGEQAFICDGNGGTTCWYRCPKKKEVGIQ